MTTPLSGAVRPELEAIIRRELAPDETVIWQTQPRPDSYGMWLSPHLSIAGWGFVGLGLLWVLMSFAMMNMAERGMVEMGRDRRPFSSAERVYFPAIGGAAFGLGLLVLRMPRWAGRGAFNAAYALTNKRVVTLAESDQPFEGRELRVRSYGPSDLDRIERTERANGVGDLVFRPDLAETSSTGRRTSRPHGLLGIDRVAEVEKLIRATLGR